MTTGVDLLVAAWRQLDADEREEAFDRLAELRLAEQAGEDSETGRYLRALMTVEQHVGKSPSPNDYRAVRNALAAEGVELPPIGHIIDHFEQWSLAKEALELHAQQTKYTTARRIDARFRSRQLGKVWRYTPETLAETMERCVQAIGRPPRVAEFDWWRERELELAKARGDHHLHLPSASPYRKRWKSWDAALVALGYDPEWVAERFDATRERKPA
jgi:hypothetical protein